MVRDGPGGVPDGSSVYRFGGWFDLRWDQHIAQQLIQRLTRGVSADRSDRDGPDILSNTLLMSLWWVVRFEVGQAYHPTSLSCRFGI